MGKVRGLNRKNRERGPAAHHRPTRERRYRAETAWFRGDCSGDRTGSNPAVPIEVSDESFSVSAQRVHSAGYPCVCARGGEGARIPRRNPPPPASRP